LSGRVAVVTGGTTGLGHAIALGLAGAGADVVPSSRRLGQVETVAAEVEALGRRSLTVASDVLDRASLEALHEAVLKEFNASASANSLAALLSGEDVADVWALWLRVGRRSMLLEQCIATSEPSLVARHAFQLAQEFNGFYKKHHILTEENPQKKLLLLATAAAAMRELIEVLGWLGIESPEAM